MSDSAVAAEATQSLQAELRVWQGLVQGVDYAVPCHILLDMRLPTWPCRPR